ncbi:MAG TPA: YciI family protein [Chthoniobacteraceae bacterium]|nr:YciI family protein [Chthoniobacteraceae bacterium]
MNTTAAKSEYLLLLRNTEIEKRLSFDEMQVAMSRFSEWLDRWKAAGAIKAGQPLAGAGKTLSGSKSRTVADGPFPESKEAVGGYILLEVGSLDEAMKIAGEWPLLDYEAFVEVRPVLDQCIPMTMIEQQAAMVGA